MSASPIINGVGLCCALGHSFEAAVAAYQAGDDNFEKSDDVVGADGLGIRLSPAFGFHEIHNPELRLRKLFATAQDDLQKQTGQCVDLAELSLVVPAWMKDNVIGDGLRDWIIAEYSGRYVSVEFVYADTTMALSEAARGLVAISEGQLRHKVVCAIDCFLHAETLDYLAVSDRLLSRQQPQ